MHISYKKWEACAQQLADTKGLKKKKKAVTGVRRPAVVHSTEGSKQDLKLGIWRKREHLKRSIWKRAFEKEDWYSLVRGLNCTLVSGCTFKRPGCTEEWGVKESSPWTLSLTCLWETPDMYTVYNGSQRRIMTPEHTGLESIFQQKPAESVVYVIRC